MLSEAERYERRCGYYKKYRAKRSPEKRAQALLKRRLWKAAHRDAVRAHNDQWYRGVVERQTPPAILELRMTLLEFWSKSRAEMKAQKGQ